MCLCVASERGNEGCDARPDLEFKKKNSERKMYIMFAYLFSGIQVGNEENNRFSWSYLRKH